MLDPIVRPAQIAATLTAAGLIEPHRPDRAARMLLALRRFGPTGATPFMGALRAPRRPAIVDEHGSVTFAELHRRTNALADAWAAAGIGPADAIGIMCRNHRWLLEAGFAASKLGATSVYLNTMFAAPQVRDVCARENVSALVYDQEFAPALQEAPVAPGRRFLAWPGESGDGIPSLEGLIGSGSDADPPPPPHHGRLVLLSSGTTGAPKGAARRKQRGMVTAAAIASRIPLRANESTMIAPPVFHGLGMLQAQLALAFASTMVLRRRFDPHEVLDATARGRCSTLVLVPAMLKRILDLGPAGIAAHDLSALRIVLLSGSNVSASMAMRALELLGDVPYNMYGSTEVAWATIATPADLRAAPGCAGRPPLGTTVRLYDEHDRPVVEPGRTGRIFVGSGLPFEGYTDGTTKAVIDGLMSTGDVGHFDAAGRLFVDGREDEMIVSGGENVFPQEVESVLERHEAIAEAAVIGVEDDAFGQRLVAYVAPAAGATIAAADVKEYVRHTLAAYKVPRDVHVVAELPRNAAGKVVKRALAGGAPATGEGET